MDEVDDTAKTERMKKSFWSPPTDAEQQEMEEYRARRRKRHGWEPNLPVLVLSLALFGTLYLLLRITGTESPLGTAFWVSGLFCALLEGWLYYGDRAKHKNRDSQDTK
jgi:hypothetical protein